MSLDRSTRWRSAVLAAALAALVPAAGALAQVTFLSPGASEALAPGSIVEVRWTSLCNGPRDREIDEAELVLSLDGGKTFPIRVTPELKPCTARFLWKVPALPTANARLALRAGAEERDQAERLEVLSADFRILPDPDGRVEALKRRAAEWWIPSQPTVVSAEDLLEKSMSAAREEIAPPSGVVEAALPTFSPEAIRPARSAADAAPSSPLSVVSLVPACARDTGAPTPLRL